MELLRELFVTAVVAVMFSFLIAKIVSMALPGERGHGSIKNVDREVGDEIIMEELKFPERLEVRRLESETKVETIEDVITETVDEFVTQQKPLEQGVESVNPEQITGPALVQSAIESVVESVSAGELKEIALVLSVPQSVVESVKSAEITEIALTQAVPESVDGVLKDDEAKQRSILEVEGANSDPTIGDEKLASVSELKEKGDEKLASVSQLKEKGVEKLASVSELKEERDEKLASVSELKEKGDEKLASVSELKETSTVEVELDDDEDWEGIEKTELDEVFAEAVKFVETGEKSETRLGSEEQMELYGLHKVAIEGPCREQPPMALKISARAKWNAWQKLGNISPEIAMEKYIALVSDKVPEWMEEKTAGVIEAEPSEEANGSAMTKNSSICSSSLQNISDTGNLELQFGANETNLIGDSIPENRAKE